MATRRQDENLDFGSDSFLDIVANIVGILIILVMVTGVRVKHFPVETVVEQAPLPDLEVAARQVALLAAEESRLARAALALQSEHRAQQVVMEQMQARMASLRSAKEAQQADAQRQRQLAKATEQEAERELKEQQGRLQSLLSELQGVANEPRKTVEIETYPTPISKAVNGPEAHFQLLGGRIAYVPLEELASVVKREIRGKVDLLRTSPELTGVVGPTYGFKLRYILERVDVPSDPALAAISGVAQVTRVTFIPESNQLGETLAEALERNSQFRSLLAPYDPARSTITLWTYPDSFAEFRQLKKELYLLGFSVAGRPLPFGKLIEGSPQGSRSAAQ